jgi:hypothetical protein
MMKWIADGQADRHRHAARDRRHQRQPVGRKAGQDQHDHRQDAPTDRDDPAAELSDDPPGQEQPDQHADRQGGQHYPDGRLA